MLVILALKREASDLCEFKANLVCIASSRPSRSTVVTPCLKKFYNKKKKTLKGMYNLTHIFELFRYWSQD